MSATIINGHRVEQLPFTERFQCSRCGAVLLTVFQFTSTECPKQRRATR